MLKKWRQSRVSAKKTKKIRFRLRWNWKKQTKERVEKRQRYIKGSERYWAKPMRWERGSSCLTNKNEDAGPNEFKVVWCDRCKKKDDQSGLKAKIDWLDANVFNQIRSNTVNRRKQVMLCSEDAWKSKSAEVKMMNRKEESGSGGKARRSVG